jgi:hypothetical protein
MKISKFKVGGFAVVMGFILVGGYFFISRSQEYVVTEKAWGFDPPELTIKKGDRVKFVSTNDKQFWPASDLHPTHEIYSDFDPKKPIEVNSSWTFKFTKEGVWKYHDHLFPISRGVIRVIGIRNNISTNLENCAKSDNKQQCWENGLDVVLKKKGLPAAYEAILTLYKSDPDFGEACHGLVHKVGEQAYSLFTSGKDFTLPANVSYCSFGFYHGFMQKLIHESNDAQQARDFCELADRQLGGVSKGTLGTCYHGVGHGAVDDYDGAWVNEDQFVLPALKFCEKISPSDQLLNRCGSGVFNAMAIAYTSGRLKINLADPLHYCRQLSKGYAQLTCYQEMNTALMTMTANNFASSAKFIMAIKDPDLALSAMESLAAVNGQRGSRKLSYEDVVADCHSLPSRLIAACIKGYATGLLQVGAADVEYERPLEFCQTSGLTVAEQRACYQELLWQTINIYPSAKQTEICHKITNPFNQPCFP